MMRAWIILSLLAPLAIGCGDDDDTSTPDASPDGSGMDGDAASGATSFTLTIENTATAFQFPASGVFDTPVGEAAAAPIGPGGAYEFTFRAAPRYPGQMDTTRLSLATMFVPSNDYFIAPGEGGIPLFDAMGMPRTGDLTTELMVWDAGTEADEPLGGDMATSPNQKQNQEPTAEDVGDADPMNMVRLATSANLPGIEEVIQLTVAATEVDREYEFTVTITNMSMAGTIAGATAFDGAVPMSPGVWLVHNQADADPGPLFTVGEPDRDQGIDDIAEDGFNTRLAMSVEAMTGITAVSSPGAWAVHTDAVSLFQSGMPDPGQGLEAIAEDGMAMGLVDALGTVDGVSSAGAIGTMPIGPGGMFTAEFTASPGDRFSFATMVVPSNDLIFAFDPAGIELFDAAGMPVSGEMSAMLQIWDAGTEIDQFPGVGLDQVHLQPMPNTGADDPDSNVRVYAGGNFPAASELLNVTITAN
ncbi:MAG: spondin domain-containing protein [Myxococcota bacterium]